MLKSVLYYLLMLTTAVRFVDMVYLLSRGTTNLPLSTLIITSAVILYGAVLVARRFFGNIRLTQLMTFFAVHAVLISINLAVVAINVPFQVTLAETFIVGSFLDILVDCCAVYAGMKQIRSADRPFVRVVGKEQV